MVVATLPAERRVALHHRALWLEYFTVGWNVVEALVAIGAGVIAGSVALIGFGADSAIEVISAVGLLWRLRKAGPHATVNEASAAEKRALYVIAGTCSPQVSRSGRSVRRAWRSDPETREAWP